MKILRMTALAAGIAALAFAPRAASAQQDWDDDELEPAEEPGEREWAPPPEEPRERVIERERERVTEPAPPPRVERDPLLEDDPRVEPDRPGHLRTPFGMGISLGGGITHFTDSGMRDFADLGGAWDARLAIGTRVPLGFEAAYVGTAQNIDALGLDSDAILVGNGVEGNLRLNLGGFVGRDVPVQPFLLGGVGWTRYDITRADFNQSNLQDQDDVFVVPTGAGISGHIGRFMLDTRFTYRWVFNQDMIRDEAGAVDDVSMSNWTVTARIGVEF
jgi:hypothetical protein